MRFCKINQKIQTLVYKQCAKQRLDEYFLKVVERNVSQTREKMQINTNKSFYFGAIADLEVVTRVSVGRLASLTELRINSCPSQRHV